MSHSNNKLFNAGPSVDGNFSTINIDALQGFPASVADGQTIIYNATAGAWEGATIPFGSGEYPVASFGRGESDDYTNSGFSITTGSTLSFYDTDPVNKMPDSVAFNLVAGTNWLESITLQPGKYEIWSNFACVFTSTGSLRYYWVDELDERRSSQGTVGELYGKSSYCLGYIDTASEMTISLKAHSALNISASQGNFPSTRSFLSIRKLL